MAALNFPSSPTNGQVYSDNGKTWIYDSTTTSWINGGGGAVTATSIAAGGGSASTPAYTFSGDTNTGIFSPGADTLAFSEGGVEAMRIDSSANLIVGTQSPSGRLTVETAGADIASFDSTDTTTGLKGFTVRSIATSGTATPFFALRQWRTSFAGNQNAAELRFDGLTTSGSYAEFASIYATTGTNTTSGAPTSLTFQTMNTSFGSGERMRIDSAGNVLVGSTTSPAGSGTNFQVANAAAARVWLTSTGFRNFYLESGEGSALQFVDGTATTERMRIDANGNLGVGTQLVAGSGSIRMQISGATSDTNGTGLDQGQLLITDSDNNTTSGLMLGYRFQSGVTEYARIQARNGAGATSLLLQSGGGNVGIGTSAATARLDLVGPTLTPSTQNTYAMWIASTGGLNGDLTFGSDSSYGYIQTWSGKKLYLNSQGNDVIVGGGSVGIGVTGPAYRLQLSADSAAKPSTSTWTIASDSRIKTETGEYTKGLSHVCNLRPVTYTYNGLAGFEVDDTEQISIIAQEAIEHFPECVGTFKGKLNPEDEEPTDLYNWNGHALTFALVNAVKELKQINEDLEARILALEAGL